MIKESMMEMQRDIDKQIYNGSSGLGKLEKFNPFITPQYYKRSW